MSYEVIFEADKSFDSEHVQTDHEFFSLLTNHSISESISSQTTISRSFSLLIESTSQMIRRMIPRGVSSVVKPLLEMRHLSMYEISH